MDNIILLAEEPATSTGINPKKSIVNTNAGLTGTETPGKGLEDNVSAIINIVIGVLGILAVVVIILGGIQYMTSNGDANKVKKAKDTILYGIIGLIIVILSAAIVNFVIANASK